MSPPEGPEVALSFANNFWGKGHNGVETLLDRMHAAKLTCDELKSFYSARASIEDDYARKLVALCRKSLGSQESGSLKTSLDTVRGEVESIAKQHQSIAAQMKTELEEPLAAFAGGMKERRKIVQNGVEKLLKIKIQQTQHVNKTRDRYEQECLKIKGYLAQGHMVMGQEERRNKAKLEKTQINVATSNTEYEGAVKALEETTARWNREWKAAADKFQDLEEERLDFTKSSLWQFANIASTVCVSDDASCEKIRLSLEKMDVQQDISTFIKDRGTGQEIPDPPRYINFCRGDVSDAQADGPEDENYSVAQFPRDINPAFRSSSPQPSTYESHNDPQSALAQDLAHGNAPGAAAMAQRMGARDDVGQLQTQLADPGQLSGRAPFDVAQHGPFVPVPHDPYPLDGMTMLCRTAPPSERSSQVASARPSSRDSQSDYSNPTSISDMASGKASPVKPDPMMAPVAQEKRVLKKKSGFFQSHSPFRRKSTKDGQVPLASQRNTWHPDSVVGGQATLHGGHGREFGHGAGERDTSPDPIDANASLALNVGRNVFPVATPDMDRRAGDIQAPAQDESDPIALALAELKGVAGGKQSSVRVSADHYHGISTPAPGAEPQTRPRGGAFGGPGPAPEARGTPPPSYDQHPVQRLGVPPPAVTSKAMREASRKVADQSRTVYGHAQGGGSVSRPGTRGSDIPRAASPAARRSASPHVGSVGDTPRAHRSASPNPYSGSQRHTPSRTGPQPQYRQNSGGAMVRAASPSPYRHDYAGSPSGAMGNDMAVQLASVDDGGFGSHPGRPSGRPGTSSGASRPNSSHGGVVVNGSVRQRSKSVVDPSRQYTRDGQPILHFARALYMYQAVIPEELGFAKGDVLAVLERQDDGWWRAEVQGGSGRIGLVPSNYLQPC